MADYDDPDTEKGSETMPCEDQDAAFILGKGGSTKQKIARVSEAELELDEKANVLTIYGTHRQRKKARDYVQFIIQQRQGNVQIDLDSGRDDMTVMRVPCECVAFVMGRGGATLRMMENEWGTLMFFAKGFGDGLADEKSSEVLMIFGPLAKRRGAEMKVMSAVEHKINGTFIKDGQLVMQERVFGDEPPDDWEVETIPLENDEFSYALGSGGATRKKLAAASGCILEYIGRLACMMGYRVDRRRARTTSNGCSSRGSRAG